MHMLLDVISKWITQWLRKYIILKGMQITQYVESDLHCSCAIGLQRLTAWDTNSYGLTRFSLSWLPEVTLLTQVWPTAIPHPHNHPDQNARTRIHVCVCVCVCVSVSVCVCAKRRVGILSMINHHMQNVAWSYYLWLIIILIDIQNGETNWNIIWSIIILSWYFGI